jgi:lysophospholipase L1-like esterase
MRRADRGRRWLSAARAGAAGALAAAALAAVITVAATLTACGSQTASPAPTGAGPTSSVPTASASPGGGRGLIVFDGCSLVYDSGLAAADMMPDQTMALLPRGLEMRNLGVPGQTTGMMAADAADQVDPLAAPQREHDILVVWEGTNDLAYGTSPPLNAAEAYRNLAEYCRARRRAGFQVVVCTVLPREGSAAFDAARSDLNERLRAGWPGFADALADVAADPTVGPDGAELDTAYYRDTVHLPPAGYGLVARRVADAVHGLL